MLTLITQKQSMHGSGYIIAIFFMLAIIIPFFYFWIKALVEIIQHDFKGDNKLVWLLIVIFAGLLGLILYYVIGRNSRILNEEPAAEVVDDGPHYEK